MSRDDCTLIGDPPPHLPASGAARLAAQAATSAALHVLVLVLAVTFAARASLTPRWPAEPTPSETPPNVTRLVFIARDPRPSGGGGGGGNRQAGPIRRAEGIGHDSITLRIAKPTTFTRRTENVVDAAPLAAVLLDAKPLASGTRDIVGLPEGGVDFGTSLGPGSGGGVGSGAGTGVGPGVGPGIGPGFGGGTGGGIYRPGGNVTPPRVITQVKPKYTEDALIHKTQGTVVLEMVVTKDGMPDAIKVIGPLDGGLDAAAVDAAKQWRFEPGRLAGEPVDVLVTLMLDFRIQ